MLKKVQARGFCTMKEGYFYNCFIASENKTYAVAVVVLKLTPVKSFLISHLSIGRMSSPLLGLQTPHLDALSKEYKQTLHYHFFRYYLISAVGNGL